jgi:hypothetical protein
VIIIPHDEMQIIFSDDTPTGCDIKLAVDCSPAGNIRK